MGQKRKTQQNQIIPLPLCMQVPMELDETLQPMVRYLPIRKLDPAAGKRSRTKKLSVQLKDLSVSALVNTELCNGACWADTGRAQRGLLGLPEAICQANGAIAVAAVLSGGLWKQTWWLLVTDIHTCRYSISKFTLICMIVHQLVGEREVVVASASFSSLSSPMMLSAENNP